MNNRSEVVVYNVALQMNIASSTSNIRFPCLFFVQWRASQKISVESGRYSPQATQTSFNQSLIIRTTVAYNKLKKMFLKRQSQVQLNLLSKSRPNEPKLVGRVTIDLSTILNQGIYSTMTQFPLQFCSVNATLTMSFRAIQKQQTDLSLNEIQRSYGDAMSFSQAIKASTSSFKEKNNQQIQATVQKCGAPFIISNSQLGKSFLTKQSENVFSSNLYESELSKESSIQPSPSKESLVNIKVQKQTLQEKKLIQISPIKQTPLNSVKSNQNFGKINEIRANINKSYEFKEQDRKLAIKIQDPNLNLPSSPAQQLQKKTKQLSNLQLENDLLKSQLSSSKNQFALLKLETVQKKMIADQISHEAIEYKLEITKLRQQLLISRQQEISLTLKLSELREAHSSTTNKLLVCEKQISRLQGASGKSSLVQVASKELSMKLSSLEKEAQLQRVLKENLKAEKEQLQDTLNKLDQLHQQAIVKCSEQENTISKQKEAYESEIRTLKEHLKSETKQKLQCQLNISNIFKQCQDLKLICSEFQEAKHSWEITRELSNEENQKSNLRVRELQASSIALGDQIRWLNCENQLLTENSRQTREEFQKKMNQMEVKQARSQQQLRRYAEVLKQSINTLQKLKIEKQNAEKQLVEQLSSNESLSWQNQQLKRELQIESENKNNLQLLIEQLQLKGQQLQELLINATDQKDKQKQQFSKIISRDREQHQIIISREREQHQATYRNMIIQKAELEGQNYRLNELFFKSEEKNISLEEQLKGETQLIQKLQQGLRSQVERNQELSSRLLEVTEKQERMKEVIDLLEIEFANTAQLLTVQQEKQIKDQNQIKHQEEKIESLMTDLSRSINYSRSLEQTIQQNQEAHARNVYNTNDRFLASQMRIKQLEEALSAKTLQIVALTESNSRISMRLNQELILIQQLSLEIRILTEKNNKGEIYLYERQASLDRVAGQLSQKEQLIRSLSQTIIELKDQIQVLSKESALKQAANMQSIRQIELKYLQSSSICTTLQSQLVIQSEKHQTDIRELQNRIMQLERNSQKLTSQIAEFDIGRHKLELQEKINQIGQLENQLKSASVQIAKIPNLERSVKIKTIELNSLKYKEKGDSSQSRELVKLKDEQILYLTAETKRMSESEKQNNSLLQKVNTLNAELESMEEEKFNIESLFNEQAVLINQIRQQNKNLVEEIVIIGQRNGQLERALHLLLSQPKKEEATSKADVLVRNAQVKELEKCKFRLHELEKRNQQLLQQLKKQRDPSVALGDRRFKSEDISTNKFQLHQGLAQTFQSLKNLIDLKNTNHSQKNILSLLQKFNSKQNLQNTSLPRKVQQLETLFQKVKVLALKFNKNAGQKIKLMCSFKEYEGVVSQIVSIFAKNSQQ